MPSVWIERRATKSGKFRYRVEFRLGGRSTRSRYAGSFATQREALVRKGWVAGELAAGRVPDLSLLAPPPVAPTLAEAAERWQASRVDISENTRLQHRSSVRLIPDDLSRRGIDTITPQDIADMVGSLHASGKKRETIRKALTALAMVLDHAGVVPNPARDKVAVKLPREVREELNPPTADHVATVFRLLPARHRLAVLWLDWSGARLGSVDGLRIADYDEPHRRIRIPMAISKTKKALWVELHPVLADAIEEAIGPREDRDPNALIFAESGSDALRTAIGKACRAAGIPPWSPHGLRHRRVSLLHERGWSWARIGEFVGQSDPGTTSGTYTHVLIDFAELDFTELLAGAA